MGVVSFPGKASDHDNYYVPMARPSTLCFAVRSNSEATRFIHGGQDAERQGRASGWKVITLGAGHYFTWRQDDTLGALVLSLLTAMRGIGFSGRGYGFLLKRATCVAQ